ncbi:MAG: hypothetical protein ACI4QI_03830 [Candidatus Coproplasma sp.]
MNNPIVERAVIYARRNAEEVDKDRLKAETLAKLQGYLSDGSRDTAPQAGEWVKVVTDYIERGEVQRNKVLLFCETFKDPTKHPAATSIRSNNIAGSDLRSVRRLYEAERSLRQEELMFCMESRTIDHATLDEKELKKIVEFIQAHKSDKPFPVVLGELMEKHEMQSPTVYRNACMSRQAFQRVYKMNAGDSVTLKMVWQIIFGLRCTIEEADELLFSAGYARHGDYYDLTLAYLIEHGVYDVELANAALEELGLDCFNLHEHKT